ncbi:MAG: ATP-binding protein [Stagnimonas sp.]|nr:ATP-binding protein [Stagnimonas sp.]
MSAPPITWPQPAVVTQQLQPPRTAGAAADAGLVARFETISRYLSLAVTVIGALVLLGYALRSPQLIRPHPTTGGMAANTAVAFLLLGLSLFLRPLDAGTAWRQPISRLCAALALAIGWVTLGEYALDVDLGMDEMLFGDLLGAVQTPHPGRMAEGTAASIALLGVASLLVHSRRSGLRRVSLVMAITVFIFALIGIYAMGFGQGAAGLYQIGIYSGIAYHTIVAFLLMAFAVLLAQVESGPLAILAAPGVGGQLARWLLPLAIVVPPVIGWLRLLGDRAQLFPNEVGVALVGLANMAIFTTALWAAARSIERLDRTRTDAETELRHASAYNRSLIEASVDPLVTISPDGKVTDANEATIQLAGLGREELIGSDFFRFFTEPEQARAAYQRVFAAGKVRDFPLQVRAKDGGITPVSYNASVFRDETGQVAGVFAIARDVSELQKAAQALRELNTSLEQRVLERTASLEAANKDLEGFSYSVSHDLRAPLRAIDSFSNILLEDYSDKLDAEGQRLLRTVRRNTDKMAQLIDDILAFSRAGRKDLVLVAIDMKELVEDVLAELIPAAGERRIEVRIATLPSAWADKAMLRQVLVNLLSNAIKFSAKREQALIEISGADDAGGTSYSIRDNGAGFDPAYSSKLFGVFQRLHSTSEFAGTGIGLAIVKRIIDKHGGRVWAESQPDQGACFHFSLPNPATASAPGVAT